MNKYTFYDSFLSLFIDYTFCSSVLLGYLLEEKLPLILTFLGREKKRNILFATPSGSVLLFLWVQNNVSILAGLIATVKLFRKEVANVSDYVVRILGNIRK